MLENRPTSFDYGSPETTTSYTGHEQNFLRVLDLQQGSTEWLLWRRYGIGSSDAPVIMNGSHFKRTRIDLWKEKLGKTLPRNFSAFQTERMNRGVVLEPDARAWYKHYINPNTEPICAVHCVWDYLKASLDGWVPSSQTILEIKCPGDRDHNTALEGRVPEKYVPQINHLILVTGAQHCHYLSYSPSRPYKERHALVSVTPDAEQLRLLLRKEEIFWGCLSQEVVPEDHLFDI